jgi:hypothetical protein
MRELRSIDDLCAVPVRAAVLEYVRPWWNSTPYLHSHTHPHLAVVLN